jgi:inosine-uridine nucleoside N-ribohydrolase
MINVLFDMETADPDDVFTLCFLTSHPDINLCAVTITPGSHDQVGLVKRVLEITGKKDVPVGSNGYWKSCVSAFHSKYLEWQACEADADAACLILSTARNFKDLVLLTGAPLKNVHRFLEMEQTERLPGNPGFMTPGVSISRWVAQGGFAGDNIVPPELRLEKFAGRNTCPTFNFNGDPEGAMMALTSPQIHLRQLVSKNVCHGVAYDREMHEWVGKHKDKSPGLELMYKGMDIYLRKKPEGKLFHDPLAAAAVVDPSVCTFKQVKMYRQKGEWGAQEAEDTNTFISISYDRDKFRDILVQT